MGKLSRADIPGCSLPVEVIEFCTYSYLPLGYPMANNLRAKIPASDVIVIHDVDRGTVNRFVAEADVARASCKDAEGGGRVEVADSPRQIGERSVGATNVS